MLSPDETAAIVAAAREVPPATVAYVDDDLVTCLLSTVVDFQMHTTAVEKALDHFRREHWEDIRTLGDLEALLATQANDVAGNTVIAYFLFGYELWTRVGLLRSLVEYLRARQVADFPTLRDWAARSDFKRDFEGQVRYVSDGRTYGLGPAVYNWLVMRLGVETVKPDVRLRRFVEAAIGRTVNDAEIVAGVTSAAANLGRTPRQLDWAIWQAGA